MFRVNWYKVSIIFFNFEDIKCQPQIIDSLFAINIFLQKGIVFKVGSKPSIPDMEFTQYSTFFKILFIFFIP